MAYFLVDTRLAQSPAAHVAGLSALGLWTRAGAWCAGHDRTFRVPRNIARELGGLRLANRLIRAGLWERDGDDYRFVPNPRIWSFQYTETERRPKIRPWLRALVLDRDDHRCLMCGATDDLQMDHIWPWSLGGPTTIENLQTLCGICNREKGARVHD